MKKYINLLIITLLLSGFAAQAQEKKYDFESMTRKEILQISYDEMLEMPFEDLKKMAEAVGVSTDELLKMALNREVSSASKKGESVFESGYDAIVYKLKTTDRPVLVHFLGYAPASKQASNTDDGENTAE